MSGDQRGAALLGTCPICGVAVSSSDLLVTYRTDDGWPTTFAECPACLAVVNPA